MSITLRDLSGNIATFTPTDGVSRLPFLIHDDMLKTYTLTADTESLVEESYSARDYLWIVGDLEVRSMNPADEGDCLIAYRAWAGNAPIHPADLSPTGRRPFGEWLERQGLDAEAIIETLRKVSR